MRKKLPNNADQRWENLVQSVAATNALPAIGEALLECDGKCVTCTPDERQNCQYQLLNNNTRLAAEIESTNRTNDVIMGYIKAMTSLVQRLLGAKTGRTPEEDAIADAIGDMLEELAEESDHAKCPITTLLKAPSPPEQPEETMPETPPDPMPDAIGDLDLDARKFDDPAVVKKQYEHPPADEPENYPEPKGDGDKERLKDPPYFL